MEQQTWRLVQCGVVRLRSVCVLRSAGWKWLWMALCFPIVQWQVSDDALSSGFHIIQLHRHRCEFPKFLNKKKPMGVSTLSVLHTRELWEYLFLTSVSGNHYKAGFATVHDHRCVRTPVD